MASIKQRLIPASIIGFLIVAFGLAHLFIPYEWKTQLGLTLGVSEAKIMLVSFGIIVLGILAFVLIASTGFLSIVKKIESKYWYLFMFLDFIKYAILITGIVLFFKTGSGVAQAVFGS